MMSVPHSTDRSIFGGTRLVSEFFKAEEQHFPAGMPLSKFENAGILESDPLADHTLGTAYAGGTRR